MFENSHHGVSIKKREEWMDVGFLPSPILYWVQGSQGRIKPLGSHGLWCLLSLWWTVSHATYIFLFYFNSEQWCCLSVEPWWMALMPWSPLLSLLTWWVWLFLWHLASRESFDFCWVTREEAALSQSRRSRKKAMLNSATEISFRICVLVWVTAMLVRGF